MKRYLGIMLMIVAAGPALADQADFSVTMDTGKVDGYGCQILPRPDHMTYTTFRDGWRSIAADKLYSLRRHQRALETGRCDCDTLRPVWSTIEAEYRDLGFASGPSTSYDAWADQEYFPVIAGLRDAVKDLCGEGK